jgi:hypothetical protein
MLESAIVDRTLNREVDFPEDTQVDGRDTRVEGKWEQRSELCCRDVVKLESI